MPCAAPSNWSMVFSPPKAIPRKNPFGNAAKLKDKNEQPKKKADSPPPKGKKDAPVDAAKKELDKAKEMAAKMEEKQEQAFCRWCAACSRAALRTSAAHSSPCISTASWPPPR